METLEIKVSWFEDTDTNLKVLDTDAMREEFEIALKQAELSLNK